MSAEELKGKFNEMEEHLKDLQTRRNILEKRNELRSATLAEFQVVKEESYSRLISTIEKNNKETKIRNKNLLNDIDITTKKSSLLIKGIDNDNISKSKEKLSKAWSIYNNKIDQLLPQWRSQQYIEKERKIKEIQDENKLSILRRKHSELDTDRKNNIQNKLDIEKRELLLSLALEQKDYMQDQAEKTIRQIEKDNLEEAIMSQMHMDEVNYITKMNDMQINNKDIAKDVVASYFEKRSQGSSSSSLSSRNKENMDNSSLRGSSTRESLSTSGGLDSRTRESQSEVSQTGVSQNESTINTSNTIDLNNSSQLSSSYRSSDMSSNDSALVLNSGILSQVSSPRLLRIASSLTSSQAVLASTSIMALDENDINNQNILNLSTLSSGINELPQDDLLPASAKFSPTSPRNSPSKNKTPIMEDINIEPFKLTPEDLGITSKLSPNSSPIAIKDKFNNNKINNPSFIITTTTIDCSIILQKLCPRIENFMEVTTNINKNPYFFALDNTNTGISSIEIPTMNFISSSAIDNEIVELDAYGVIHWAATVLYIIKEKGNELLPNEALNGVVTVDRLKKEHKKRGGGRAELWTVLSIHLQKLLEYDNNSLDNLSQCFTNALIHHISNVNDRDRIERKVHKLVQLTMITEGSSRSPSPPSRFNKNDDLNIVIEKKNTKKELENNNNNTIATSSLPPKPPSQSTEKNTGLSKAISSYEVKFPMKAAKPNYSYANSIGVSSKHAMETDVRIIIICYL
jgi:hypothetical protein